MTQKTGQYPTQYLHNKPTLRETLACFIQSTCFGYSFVIYFFYGTTSPQWARASSLSRMDDHTQAHHTLKDSSGRVISPTQKPVPDNTLPSQETHTHVPSGIRNPQPQKASSRRAHASDRAATGMAPPFPDTPIKIFIAFFIILYPQEPHRPTTMLKS